MKVALVYDRVNKWGGAERVLLTLHEMFPKAPLYTSVYNKTTSKWAKVFPEVIPSFLQEIPVAHNHHEYFATLMPFAFEYFNFDKFDVVISVTSEAAKGIITKGKTYHISYCLTPTRYLWSGYKDYFSNPLLRVLSWPVISYLKYWDRIASKRPDQTIAISTEVKRRIKRYYGLDSKIVYPPVEDIFLTKKLTKSRENFYLLIGRMVPYKKFDLAIEAFNQLGLPLLVIGTGSEETKLKKMAKNNISFTRNISDEELISYYDRAKALIFPQEEDFGLIAAEAQARGTPVIGYQKGGAVDIIQSTKTGLLFQRQSVKSLKRAIYQFEKMKFDSKIIHKNALRFSKANFKNQLIEIINNI